MTWIDIITKIDKCQRCYKKPAEHLQEKTFSFFVFSHKSRLICTDCLQKISEGKDRW